MRYGRDEQDTHENMQLNRHARKYERGKTKRHLGKNRLRHKGDNSSIPGQGLA